MRSFVRARSPHPRLGARRRPPGICRTRAVVHRSGAPRASSTATTGNRPLPPIATVTSTPPGRTTSAMRASTPAIRIPAARLAQARTRSCRSRATAGRRGRRPGHSGLRRNGRTIRRSSSTPQTERRSTPRSCRTTSRASTLRARTTSARRGAQSWSSRFSAEPTRTSSPRATATSTSSTTRNRRSSLPCRMTAARHWSTHNLVGTTNSELGVSLPSGGAIDSKGNAYFAWNGINNPGQAKGTKNLYVTRSTDGGATWTTSLVDVSQPSFRCGCPGWDYWGSQMALGIDAKDRDLRRSGTRPTRAPESSACTSPALSTAPPPGARRQTSRSPPPDRTICSRPSPRAATATCASPGWTIETASTPAATIRARAGTSTTARRRTAAASWSAEAKLSQYVAGYAIQVRDPEGRLRRAVR